MDIDYLHLYVDQVAPWRRWFIRQLGAVSPQVAADQPTPLYVGQVVLLLSDPTQDAGAAAYLERHPPGVGDLAFRVDNLDQVLSRALQEGSQVISPVQERQSEAGHIRWAQIQGWGSLRHTLVERKTHVQHGNPPLPRLIPGLPAALTTGTGHISAIDHAVLNVAAGTLSKAVAWYERVLGFSSQQQFVIQTPNSGLYSQVLKHPNGKAQLPINEPTTHNSQIQEFLNWHRGDGIQHAALLTTDIVNTVADLRQRGLKFLAVPDAYYDQITERSGFSMAEPALKSIRQQQILIDWDVAQPQVQLLQTFTQSVFGIPTLFFELIERQRLYQQGQLIRAEGFGEGNFQALFEAMEREQSQRGSLQASSGESC